jgi:hypothetical protein
MPRHWTDSTIAVEAVMATFTLNVRPRSGDEVELPPRTNKRVGDQLLLVRRPLVDPQTNIEVGSFNARLTVMEVPAGDVLFSGNADHEVPGGVISTQGSFNASDTTSVFAIVGGSGTYALARGTLTLTLVGGIEQFTYDWS